MALLVDRRIMQGRGVVCGMISRMQSISTCGRVEKQ